MTQRSLWGSWLSFDKPQVLCTCI